MIKQIIIGISFLGAIGFTYSLAQNESNNVKNTTIKKRGCFSDSNNNGICDNYEKRTCRNADFNEKDSTKKANRCDGSGYSLNQKKQLKKDSVYK
ncbi:MAG: hypothetical protein ACK5ND_10215 [Bacteroides sp.]